MDTPTKDYSPTDRERLIDAAMTEATGTGLWAHVADIRSKAPGWGWDKVAAELYRRSNATASVSGAGLKGWHRRRAAAS